MSEGFGNIVRGIRPDDWVLAGVLTAAGCYLMLANVLYDDAGTAAGITAGTMVHELSTHSWAMVPVLALATVAVLWWRRGVMQ